MATEAFLCGRCGHCEKKINRSIQAATESCNLMWPRRLFSVGAVGTVRGNPETPESFRDREMNNSGRNGKLQPDMATEITEDFLCVL